MITVPQRPSALWNSIKLYEVLGICQLNFLVVSLFTLKLKLFFLSRYILLYFFLVTIVCLNSVIVCVKDLCFGEKHSFTGLYKGALVFNSHCLIEIKPWYSLCLFIAFFLHNNSHREAEVFTNRLYSSCIIFKTQKSCLKVKEKEVFYDNCWNFRVLIG